MVKLKRAYEASHREDGYRILVDRLWPRGISKEKAHIDRWAKEFAPSTELRQWFNHDPKKWEEFKQRYALELEPYKTALNELSDQARSQDVTLVYGARDTVYNDAVALREILERRGE